MSSAPFRVLEALGKIFYEVFLPLATLTLKINIKSLKFNQFQLYLKYQQSTKMERNLKKKSRQEDIFFFYFL